MMRMLFSLFVMLLLFSVVVSAQVLSLTNITVRVDGSISSSSASGGKGQGFGHGSGSSFVLCGNDICGVNEFCVKDICEKITEKSIVPSVVNDSVPVVSSVEENISVITPVINESVPVVGPVVVEGVSKTFWFGIPFVFIVIVGLVFFILGKGGKKEDEGVIDADVRRSL